MSHSAPNTGELFSRLVEVMARLRAPGGCPWDREQTFDSIKPYTLEETYEVLDAIDDRDWQGLAEELGDYILQAVFYAQMASEEGLFHIDDSLRAINEKLVRRHPHVFGGATARTASDVTRHWEEIKLAEKARKAEAREGSVEASLLDGVSRAQPALAEAQQLGTKAGKAGFDWPEASGVMAKIHEEIEEIAGATDPQDIEEELGDLLLALASLARFHKVDAEQSLRRANAKFRRRFAYVESELGKPLTDATLEEMEAKWQEAKRREAQQRNHRPDAAALKQTQP